MSNVSQRQFGNMWDDHTDDMRKRAQEYPAEGRMSVEEMKQRADPVFSPWHKFVSNEHGYISNLADHVKREGVINPVILTEEGMIYDGHHRVAAAEMAGQHDVPWRRVQREMPIRTPEYKGPPHP